MSRETDGHSVIRGAVFTQQIGYHLRRAESSLRRLVSMATAMGLDTSQYASALAVLEAPPKPKPVMTLEEAREAAKRRRAGAEASPWRARAVAPKRSRGVQ